MLLPWASRHRGATGHLPPLRDLYLSGATTLGRPDDPYEVGLLVAHDLEVFRQIQEFSPHLSTRNAVLAIDLPAVTEPSSDGTVPTLDDVRSAIDAARSAIPGRWAIRPVGEQARAWLDRSLPDVALGEDWPRSDADDALLRTVATLVPGGPAADHADDTIDRPTARDRSPSRAQPGPPAWVVGPLGRRREEPVSSRVAFITDNGHGLGHLTRLMAIARRLPPRVAPVFLTLSEAHPVVRRMGFPVEHHPSRHRLGITAEQWEEMLAIRLRQWLGRVRPSTLVIDHGRPPAVVTRIAREAGVAAVWSRRGLWKPGRNREALDLEPDFDAILEPGDVAAPLDRGPTRNRSGVTRVDPITLVDRDDLLPRDRARSELGLPTDGAVLLLQLTADDSTRFVELVHEARAALRTHDVTVFVPRHPLHDVDLEITPGVVAAPVYPVARYLEAFDAAVSMTGYNSFHELLLARVPTLFLARETDSVDDQQARGRAAALAGAALTASGLDVRALPDLVGQLLDPTLRSGFRTAAAELYPGNGAADAARLVAGLDGGEQHDTT